MTTADAGVYDHRIADVEATVGIALGHMAKTFDAHGLRQLMRDASAAVAHVEIDLVERAGLHAQQHFACLSLGCVAFAYFHHLVATVAVDVDRFHLKSHA